MKRFHYQTIDSTNSQASRLVNQGKQAPFLVSATTQSAGRGRNGRVWQSPSGGAWMSAAWPISSNPANYMTFPLVTGLAAWHAICEVIKQSHSFEDHRLKIKWPNDILLDGKKVCGILCETVSSGADITHMIAGVGINVAFSSDVLTGKLRHPPTSLSDHFDDGQKWIEPIIQAFQNQFEKRMIYFDHHGFDQTTHHMVLARLAYVGQIKTWQFGDQSYTGAIEGIDDIGRLLIEIDGATQPFDYGEIRFADSVHL